MAPPNVMDCSIVCVDGVLSHYPYLWDREIKDIRVIQKWGENRGFKGPSIVPGSTVK